MIEKKRGKLRVLRKENVIKYRLYPAVNLRNCLNILPPKYKVGTYLALPLQSCGLGLGSTTEGPLVKHSQWRKSKFKFWSRSLLFVNGITYVHSYGLFEEVRSVCNQSF